MSSLSLTVNGTPGGDQAHDPSALITITEVTSAGGQTALKFVVEVVDTNLYSSLAEVADLRALFFHVAQESLLSGLSVTDKKMWLGLGGGVLQEVPFEGDIQIREDDVTSLGDGKSANLNGNGGGNDAAADIGIEFGSGGMGLRQDGLKDDVRKVEFVLSHSSQNLTINDFLLSSEVNTVVVRMQSVGVETETGRVDSSKLRGDFDDGTYTPSDPSPPPPPPEEEPISPPPPPVVDRDDLIEGGDGDDLIDGGEGDDEIQGEGGNDLIIGGTDNGSVTGVGNARLFKIGDNLYGNDGNDKFVYAKGDGVDLIWDFQPGQDVIRLHGFTIDDLDNVEIMYVKGVANRIGTGNHNKIAIVFNGDKQGAIILNDFPNPSAGGNAVEFVGADGVVFETYSALELLDAANETLAQNDGAAAGADHSTVLPGRVIATGPKGVDRFGTNGPDTLVGEEKDDQLFGNEGVNELFGLQGNDALYGGNAQDVMLGGDGDDRLYGNAGDDTLVGGNGNDSLYGTGGRDIIFGDSFDFSLLSAKYGVDAAWAQGLVLPQAPLPSVVPVVTPPVTPTVVPPVTPTVTSPVDPVGGDDGDDSGLTDDTIDAGPEAEVFTIYKAKPLTQITGFDSGLDEIHLDDKFFKKLGVGTEDGTPLKKGMFVANDTGLATSKKGVAQIVYETDTGNLYYDSDGKGKKAGVHFATLTDKAKVAIDDFGII